MTNLTLLPVISVWVVLFMMVTIVLRVIYLLMFIECISFYFFDCPSAIEAML